MSGVERPSNPGFLQYTLQRVNNMSFHQHFDICTPIFQKITAMHFSLSLRLQTFQVQNFKGTMWRIREKCGHGGDGIPRFCQQHISNKKCKCNVTGH